MATPSLETTGAVEAPRSCADLFWSFTVLALQGWGGVVAVVQRELVERKRWMTREQFLEDWSVAQIMPGPNVVNLALMFGWPSLRLARRVGRSWARARGEPAAGRGHLRGH